MKQVTVYTDGACLGNPGPGGYGVVMIYGTHRKELSGGFRRTTNNRMELMGAIVALESLKESCDVSLHSDSRYVVESYSSGAASRWRANGWMRDRKNPALNVDLWSRLLAACAKHRVRMTWVEGHAGNKENERCDLLSVQGAKMRDLPADAAYEENRTRQVDGLDSV